MVSTIVILLVLISTIVGSFGLLYIKRGSSKTGFGLIDLRSWMRNKELILGIVLFFLGMMAVIIALRYEDLSVVFPMTSVSYIWVALISRKYLGEKINAYKWLGILLIIVGVVLVSL